MQIFFARYHHQFFFCTFDRELSLNMKHCPLKILAASLLLRGHHRTINTWTLRMGADVSSVAAMSMRTFLFRQACKHSQPPADTRDVDISLWYLYWLTRVDCILYILLICDRHKRTLVVSILYSKRFCCFIKCPYSLPYNCRQAL